MIAGRGQEVDGRFSSFFLSRVVRLLALTG